MRCTLSLALMTSFTVVLQAPRAAGQDAAPATLIIRVPESARLFFSDAPTQQTGTTRTFATPPLAAGRKYSYDIRAELVRNGQKIKRTKHVAFAAGQTVEVDFADFGSASSASQNGAVAAEQPKVDIGWPRKLTAGDTTLTIYQPQVDTWEHNRLSARAAVAVDIKGSTHQTFGVIWINARTDVDKEDRIVTMHDFTIQRASFPTAEGKADEYLALIRKHVPEKMVRTIGLEKLEANLAVTQAEIKAPKRPIKNDPPRVIYSKEPAALVLIDGPPTLRQFVGTRFMRVVNTRALLVFEEFSGKYYLHMLEHWLESKSMDGPWKIRTESADLRDAENNAKRLELPVDLFDDLAADLKAEMEEGKVPVIYVSTVPAELIMTKGEPQWETIAGTRLQWAKNSPDSIFLIMDTKDYYILVSGRWFRSKSLAQGPWEFVAGDKLPADFAKIPETHPRGNVLIAVAGTPQAKEALIAHYIPQTATVKRSDTHLEVRYDGDPQFEPIVDTKLRYAINTPTPVIQVDPSRYYAVENGVWFNAGVPDGPWEVADAVPEEIYDIPPSNPLNYVTNVRVYGSTPGEVYMGYTPGYFGTYVQPWGTVAYGTGFGYRPWIGNTWYGRPASYGYGARFGYSPTGIGFGFAATAGRPYWGPVGWNRGYAGGNWRAGWENGWGGRYAGVPVNNIDFYNFNAYNRWGYGGQVAPGPQGFGYTNVSRGINNVYAGPDGYVYRRFNDTWMTNATGGWQNYERNYLPQNRAANYGAISSSLNYDYAARRGAVNSANRYVPRVGYVGTSGFGWRR